VILILIYLTILQQPTSIVAISDSVSTTLPYSSIHLLWRSRVQCGYANSKLKICKNVLTFWLKQ